MASTESLHNPEEVTPVQGDSSGYTNGNARSAQDLFLELGQQSFIQKSAPPGVKVMCHIERKSTSSGIYNLFLEDPETNTRRFLLASKKLLFSKSAHYIISTSKSDPSRENQEAYVGKLRANILGTTFTAYDSSRDGVKNAQERERRPVGRKASMPMLMADQPPPPKPSATRGRSLSITSLGGRDQVFLPELALITYDTNILGVKGPRRMTVVIPAMGPDGSPFPWVPKETSETLSEVHKGGGCSTLCVLENKTPQWNEEIQSYTLDFKGRVTMASVKNFQLVHQNDPDYIVMQMGKISDNVFTMDYSYPLSAQQAFSIALSSFHGKLACE
eukprot:Colp12_sorted_trinity150504_noHs@350